MSFYSRDNNDILSITKLLEFNEILDNDLGLNMMIEENGFNLSGGQRQRIVLARALLKKSKIILIDEGLSQVDVEKRHSGAWLKARWERLDRGNKKSLGRSAGGRSKASRRLHDYQRRL